MYVCGLYTYARKCAYFLTTSSGGFLISTHLYKYVHIYNIATKTNNNLTIFAIENLYIHLHKTVRVWVSSYAVFSGVAQPHATFVFLCF